jgi:hypothetical protein
VRRRPLGRQEPARRDARAKSSRGTMLLGDSQRDRAEGLGGNKRMGGSPVVARVSRSLQGTTWGLGLRHRRAIQWAGGVEMRSPCSLKPSCTGIKDHHRALGRPRRQRLHVDEDQRRFPALKPNLMSLPTRVWHMHRYEHELGMDTDRS